MLERGATDAEPLLFHGEVVLRDGEPIGDVRAGSIGWTVGAGVGLAFVHHEAGVSASWLAEGGFEIDINGELVRARLTVTPPYDPSHARVRKG